ncbi:B12-binding domain-containing protein [Aestuariibius sp. 2305UL40-4]|uniref:cobalamin B12-binding domain-containing protein n=1 Tax=Aestuariibius violaceus TaxID=3234132 RepID=UPI00345EDBBC
MSDHPKRGAAQSAEPGSASVDSLASEALSVVASRKQSGSLIERFVSELTDAVQRDAPDMMFEVRDRMLDSGISPVDISDFYVPEAARRLGEAWCADETSFAAVTIGASRLQGLLRTLGAEWSAQELAEPNAPASLIIVAHEVYHTLGAVILSGQLRRRGYAVRLLIGMQPDKLEHLIRQTTYDVVMISASSGDRLEPLRVLVEKVKDAVSEPPPVIVGGTVLEQKLDVRTLTGADYVTSDLNEALEYCGLSSPQKMPAHNDSGR